MDKFEKFFQLVKVDEAQRFVYGLVAEQQEDADGETFHYDSSKPQYQATNDKLSKASDGENIMPLREMHQLKAVGAGKTVVFDDAKKQIHMGFKVVDDSTWKKVTEKVLLGFSHGGKYLKKWNEGGKRYYTCLPGEVSLVDHPCMPNAFIEYVKADGSTETLLTPAAKLTDAEIAKITKSVTDQLGTTMQDLSSELARHMRQTIPNTGEDMISEDDFKKQSVPSDNLEKAKKGGIAAVHAHMENLISHQESIHKAHGAMGDMHEKMATHLAKCMKACKDVMGSDEKEAEKAIKSLVDELKAAPTAPAATPPPAITGEQIAAIVKAEVEKGMKEANDKLLADPKASLFAVRRDGEVTKTATANYDPMPV